eukprot:gnl/MRDRNA2_/MRDRNA2_27713_c0_seq1.p1 gnl/MRDRNA2_/MRDRNA2_27713_c0~~gnl/MRDRNA2_/MRDRNA2_27713_c0_seq1.p1  ORF type:complete len:197 (+),score=18.04 gnl/MRDRNA2_/MRDRNA2_27713_c0_seq1:71-661(+)
MRHLAQTSLRSCRHRLPSPGFGQVAVGKSFPWAVPWQLPALDVGLHHGISRPKSAGVSEFHPTRSLITQPFPSMRPHSLVTNLNLQIPLVDKGVPLADKEVVFDVHGLVTELNPQMLPSHEDAPKWLPVECELPSAGTGHVEYICNQHWYRIVTEQRRRIKGIINPKKWDCGPRGSHWEWLKAVRKKLKKRTRKFI